MSAQGLTSEAQLRYLLQWFAEFSELQREDFLPILASARRGETEQLTNILNSLTCEDKPISLFQCRVKLFNDWFHTWAETDQDRLVQEISVLDPEFGKKLENQIINGPEINGEHNAFTFESESSNVQEKDEDTQETNFISNDINEVTPQEVSSLPVNIAATS